jgi:hypothetical protein
MLESSALLFALLLFPADSGHRQSLVRNGGLETNGGWHLFRAALAAEGNPGRCIRCGDQGAATQEVLVAGKRLTLTVAVDVKTSGVAADSGKRGYAFAAVYQTDESGRLIATHDFVQQVGTRGWQRSSYTFTVDPKADFVSLRCGLFQATGTACFDNWTLVAGEQAWRLDEVAEPLSRPANPAGAVAVLDEPEMPVKGSASSAERIAAILAGAGMATERLTADQLADPTVLNSSRFNLVVLPTGESFPAAARLVFREFLRGGGGFITTGGYAFNHLVRKAEGRWGSEEERNRARLHDALAASRSLLPNGGFEQDQSLSFDSALGRWHRTSTRCEIVSESPKEGQFCAKAVVPGAAGDGGSQIVMELSAKPGTTYHVSCWMRASEVNGPGMAFMALYQFDAAGKLVEFADFAVARGTTPWRRHDYAVTPAAGVARLSLRLGLYQAQGTAWFDDIRMADVTGIEFRPMNTALGKPEDGLNVAPEQIGVFDPSYPLRRARQLKTAAEQQVIGQPIDLQGDWQGWAASGVVGYDDARWVPLLETYDRYGRCRGPAAAMTLHYNGNYAGSSWAYFGIENADLLADSHGPMARALQDVARFMVRGLFLHNLATGHRLYRADEPPAASVLVENQGAGPKQARVEFTMSEFGSARILARIARDVDLAPGEGTKVDVAFPALKTDAPVCQVSAVLSLGGQVIDKMTAGFVVDRPGVLQAAPDLRFADNYFTLGGRSLFLFGSDDYVLAYKSAAANPLVWLQELAAARDIGLNLYENLQYNNPGHVMTDDDWRAFQAMSQLTQQMGLVFMPGMLIGHNVVASDEALAAQSRLCREYARHLGGTPSLLYYINGDYVLRLDDEPQTVNTLWNRWLASEYGTTDRLRGDWGVAAVQGELGSLSFPPPNSGRWDDAAAIATARFRNWLVRRWNQAHVDAVRQVDSRHAITSEYYSRPMGGIDLVLSIDGQDVSNIGYFKRPQEDIDNLPLAIRWNDLRARGRGVSLGEYGVKTHPAWSEARGGRDYHIARTEEEQNQLFLAVGHYGLGLGASKVQNWCLRDADNAVFPWGLFYPNQLVPKDVAYVHRNQAIVWRHFTPVYQPSPLVVCLANGLRLGNNEALGPTAAYQTFADLLALHYPFQTLDDGHLDQLSPATRTMIYPAPFALPAETYKRLLGWVRSGGTLLVTGDFSYDASRKRTQAARLAELAGVEFVAANYENVSRSSSRDVALKFSLSGLTAQAGRPCIRIRSAGAEVLGATGAGDPVLVRNAYGQGMVYYFTDPVELSDTDQAKSLRRELYRAVLKTAAAGMKPPAVNPDAPWLHVMPQPTAKGMVYVLYNTRTEAGTETVGLPTAAGMLRVGTRNRWPAFAGITREGRLVAVSAYGRADIDGKRVMSGTGLKAMLSLDRSDLRQSEALLVAPFEPGRVELDARSGARLAVIGEFRDSRWTVLERIPLPEGQVALDLNADRATCLVLICRAGQQEHWGNRLTEAMLRPDRIEGY